MQGTGGVWTAEVNVADLNQLTLGGARMTEARHPNEAPADPIRGGRLLADEPTGGIDPYTQIVVRPEDRGAAALAPGGGGAFPCERWLGPCGLDGAGP